MALNCESESVKITKVVNKNIFTKVKEEMIVYDPLCVEEIHKLIYGETNTVVDDIDIIKHKIETDI